MTYAGVASESSGQHHEEVEFIQKADIKRDVTPDVLRHWLRHSKRKFRQGVKVYLIQPTGKPVNRTMFIGAKKEYFELISTTVYDTAYHLSEVEDVKMGNDSPDFVALQKIANDPSRLPKQAQCIVITLKGSTISIVFKEADERRDAEFLLRVEMYNAEEKFARIAQQFESKQREAGLLSDTEGRIDASSKLHCSEV